MFVPTASQSLRSAATAAACLLALSGTAVGDGVDPCRNCTNTTLVGVRTVGAAGGVSIVVELTLTPSDATIAECTALSLVTAQGSYFTSTVATVFPPSSRSDTSPCLEASSSTPLEASLWFPSVLATCPVASSCSFGCSPSLCIGGSAIINSSARAIGISTQCVASVGSVTQYLDCCGAPVTTRGTALELGLAAARSSRSMRFTKTGPNPRLLVTVRVVASPCGGPFTCEFGDVPQSPLGLPAGGSGGGAAPAPPSFVSLSFTHAGGPLGSVRGRLTPSGGGFVGSGDFADVVNTPDPVTGVPSASTSRSLTVPIPVDGLLTLELASVTQALFSGDINGDGSVTLADLNLLCDLHGATDSEPRYTLAADPDGSGVIDAADVAALLPRFAQADLNNDGVVDAADAALARPCEIRCPADLARSDGSPGPDGRLDNGDFSAFFASFFAGCDRAGSPCATADIAADDAAPTPDGAVTNGDFSLFFSSFFGGCG